MVEGITLRPEDSCHRKAGGQLFVEEPAFQMVSLYSGAALTKSPRLCGLNIRNVSSHSPGGQKSNLQGSTS